MSGDLWVLLLSVESAPLGLVEDGGRLAAAPTAYPKVRLIFCRARCPIGPFSGGPVCRPYEIWETFRSFRRDRSQTGPRAAKGRPYGGNGPVALARQSQAQFLNRTIRNFPSNRPPKAAPNAKPSVAGLRWRGGAME